jgi:hypothetical protein
MPTYRIFVDTNVVTLFPFLERPDDFLPRSAEYAIFSIVLPTVRELERIKGEHWSEGQRKRAKTLLDKLERAESPRGVQISDKASLQFEVSEPSTVDLQGCNLNLNSPDDAFVACAFWAVKNNQAVTGGVISADVGVRARARHQLRHGSIVYAPPDELRFKDEDFNLPQLVKTTVKELAKQLASELRSED